MKTITQSMVTETIKKRATHTHKGSFGRLLVIGGNAQFGGAIILTSSAAVYSGTGLVTTATHSTNFASLHARLPETMVIDFQNDTELKKLIKTVDGIVIGPGLGEDKLALQVVQAVFQSIQSTQHLIIDGSAIDLVAAHHLSLPDAKIVFTPHEMEWQRLSGIPIAEQTETKNRKAQQKLQATVVLKKYHTEIYTNDTVYQLKLGGPEMATGGMGDTLAGMIGGFVVQFSDHEIQAILSATYLHSYIADELGKTQYVTLPHQIINQIPQAMAKFSKRE
ncbi:NAD(P)H-hydrate dehydratase [Pediococcus parvulus]|jgi:ADP-dependent NAD(P)H-hydrate dehydratase|uniref:ADP-dependent (S)-NAD(P)H-hydrate dehydratase n=1 Tax=Pediococcus parvulus TaxID=54062 RepID=A0A176TL49_9LACO|nr:NAD(P)H-hydrate dehydratase [Pediococcus parvulus]MCT3027993.1 NAD(P)H-hydrate dehydratase [Pediococcus parvulus]MCT3030309.1 NAD(P)H-hydrate dehydratase [Pediococcus parvulus]MDV7694790.1 NAD(P)H-hydrate dehydratase [Pediococcus parvulus]OAD64693.1 NAD(P)H-hydrate dehydratase [Pediococcus parvulus]GEL90390.1 ADP-dependent (S)-NAD(P)H-hydrate dehydratase [Pediococcus parvulus]